MANTISPNMNLIVPGVGTEQSPTWATDLNASLSIIDGHNHSPGQGVQIGPSGLNINEDLSFQDNNATQLRSTRFQSQSGVLSGALDLGCVYVVGNELYYNDVTGGNNVQITSNGSVNATSSGISSGTASAAFSAGTLVVKSSSTSGADILMLSAVLTNSGNLTNQLTVQAPSLSGSAIITLPVIPASTLPVSISSGGTMSAAQITTTQIADGAVTTTQIASQTIAQGNLALRATGSTVVAGGVATSSSCGSFSSGDSSITNVTNLSVTITTTGRPIFVGLMQDGSGSGNPAEIFAAVGSGGAGADMYVYLYNSTQTSYVTVYQLRSVGFNASGDSEIYVPSSSVMGIDFQSAGTYTYLAQISVPTQSGGPTAGVQSTVLVAYEL